MGHSGEGELNRPPERFTVAEFQRLPDSGPCRLELSRGLVVGAPAPGALHGRTQTRLTGLLNDFAEENDLGVVLSQAGFVLQEAPPTVRAPDLAFVARNRVPEDGYGESYWHLAPDLAVEIISLAHRFTEVQDRVSEYLEAGTRQVWLVDPTARTVMLLHSDEEMSLVRAGGSLDGGDVLPGLHIPLARLFAI